MFDNKIEFAFSDSFWVKIYSNIKTSQKPAKEKRKLMIIEAIREKRVTKRGFAEEINVNKSTIESNLEELRYENNKCCRGKA